MSIVCRDIVEYIESFAPPRLAEEWDNVGLLIGSNHRQIGKVLVCLDVTSEVAKNAVNEKVDLIISHHPVIFKGLKRINEDDTKGNIIYQLIQNNIGVYSAHTNLDVSRVGINRHLASLLGLSSIKSLKSYKPDKLYKIVVFVPLEHIEQVRDAMSREGAGWIGNYSDCSFMIQGTGTFKPLNGSHPYIGKEGELERVGEMRLETIVSQDKINKVLEAMVKAHPYEEVAYDVYSLENAASGYYMGVIGQLSQPVSLNGFIQNIKTTLQIPHVRLVGSTPHEVKSAAVFCGSFDESLMNRIKGKVDVLVTGDIKYHVALDMKEMGICAIDAGHFNTERIIVPVLQKLLSDQFKELEIIMDTKEEDPFSVY